MSAFCVVQVSYLLKSKVFNIGKRIACLKDFLEEKGSNGNSNKIRIAEFVYLQRRFLKSLW